MLIVTNHQVACEAVRTLPLWGSRLLAALIWVAIFTAVAVAVHHRRRGDGWDEVLAMSFFAAIAAPSGLALVFGLVLSAAWTLGLDAALLGLMS